VNLFDAILIVDWSAASRPVIGLNTVWLGLARPGRPTVLENPPTRAEAAQRIATILTAESADGRRVLAGFDFPFGYPRGVAGRLTGRNDALALWRWLAERIEDGADNANNRFAVASEMARAWPGLGPFWGRPATWDFPDIPEGGRARHGEGHPPERRAADARATGAKTVWQLAYAGSVGSQVLLGLPMLARLRDDARLAGRIAVWPFETGLRAPEAPIVLAEVYPSLVPPHRYEPVRDAGQVRATAERLVALDAEDRLAPLFAGPPDLTQADRAAIETEEAWILGAGAEAVLRGDPAPEPAPVPKSPARRPLRYLKDPAAIYAESFATVAREVRLDRFPEGLRDVAARIVHACGMPEVADRLAFSADAGEAGRLAIGRHGAIICDCTMVAAGIRLRDPGERSPVIVTLNDPRVPGLARDLGTTRSAAAVELWRDRLAGAVVVIGNAPTALFHLLERLDAGWPRPALILGFPVGFVGAAEAKAELVRDPRGVPFLTLRGRRGGSAMAAAAVNALAAAGVRA
jgi:precorrin-8X/cobalt-precorrin-8 methylmutase